MMRRKGLARTALLALAAVSLIPMRAEAVDRCKVTTIGYDRPDFFCEFYADGPIEYTAIATSGWRIDRLIKQKNDGTLVWKELAGMPPNNGGYPPAGPYPPVDAKMSGVTPNTGTLYALEGWRIRVQVLASAYPYIGPPMPPQTMYRNGYIEAVS